MCRARRKKSYIKPCNQVNLDRRILRLKSCERVGRVIAQWSKGSSFKPWHLQDWKGICCAIIRGLTRGLTGQMAYVFHTLEAGYRVQAP